MAYTPTQTLTKNTLTGNWELNENGTDKTYTNTLQTAGKVVSGDIDINITAKNATIATPTIAQSTVVDNQIVFTPSIEIIGSGWVDEGTYTGNSITIGASDLVSGAILIDNTNRIKFITISADISMSNNMYGRYVWYDSLNWFYSENSIQKKWNKTSQEWEDVTWSGLSNFDAQYIWGMDSTEYYSKGSTQKQRSSLSSNLTWNNKSWVGLSNFDGIDIWQRNGEIYYSSGTTHYKYNKSTSQWESIIWEGMNDFYGRYIWDNNTTKVRYYSNGTIQKILNVNSDVWEDVTWTGLTNFNAQDIFSAPDTNGFSAKYYSNGSSHFRLVSDGFTQPLEYVWEQIPSNNNLKNFDGIDVFYLNDYYFAGNSNSEYAIYKIIPTATDVTNYSDAYVKKSDFYGTDITYTVSNKVANIYAISSFGEGYVPRQTSHSNIISIQPSDLVSGTYTITQQIGTDITNYKYANVQGATLSSPVAEKGSVSEHKVTITPKVNISQAGWVANGTISGTAITVTASELASGTVTLIKQSDTDVSNYKYANVRSVTASMPASLSGSSASASLNGAVLTLTKTLTNYASITQSGWINTLSGNTEVSLSGVVPTENIEITPTTSTQTITHTDGKLINKVTVKNIKLQSKSVIPSTSTQTITASATYDGLSSVEVNAITVGTSGTPIAEKGTVSDNKVVITPKVTNTEGYISGGTITGNTIEVSASELVSGTITLAKQTGTDVTNYKDADVRSATVSPDLTYTISPTLHKVVINPQISVTQSGWLESGSTGTSLTITASQLVSGSLTITDNADEIDVTNYEKVNVQVPKGITPTGNITITQQSETDVTNYATADVRIASSFTLQAQNNTSLVSVGSKSGGYYTLTNSITATLTAGTPGWFSNASANDSSVQVGRITAAALNVITSSATTSLSFTPGTVSVADNISAITGKTQITASLTTTSGDITSNYYMAIRPTVSAGSYYTNKTPSTYTITSSISTAGYIPTTSKDTTINAYCRGRASAKAGSTYYIPIPTTVTSVTPSTSSQTITATDGVLIEQVTVDAVPIGSITYNVSGGSSSGTINRGSQIKIGSGYYENDLYYTAQNNSGVMPTTITSNGTHSCDGYTAVNVSITYPIYDGSYTENVS